MKRTLYQFLLLLLLLTGCNDPKPVTDTLTRAEALMNEYPDSAWAVLNTLSPDEMGQNRTRAHYVTTVIPMPVAIRVLTLTTTPTCL